MKNTSCFYVDLLETYNESQIQGRILPLPPPIKIEGIEEYEVDDIFDSQII